ncbi:serine hydrolase domain-containing protein [Hydrogenophaga pseudoflava]|uniref:serine hydrolase domain-containing protein n=1 Tax=Hydrogenophaga pseudoflava TaxID=47421 RepID=UPI0027E43A55|nr:serine hydrolase domain-containing protein [Hydrogenophaga pseudoflava]MDQ7745591.1 serine hydrolase domain-containing protein [Hydrogenophaga pseudoflava]
MTVPPRRTALKGLAIALGAAALPGCASRRAPVPPIRQGDTAAALGQLDAWVQQQLRRHASANLSVAVLDGQQLAWSAGYGLADPSSPLPATARTRYRAGSISKVFTTMAVMQLAEQGRLNLDAPLSDALPAFRIRSRFTGARQVTVRQILQHRSGLPSDRVEGMWTDAPESLSDLVLALHEEHLAFPPGEVQSYCNLGFSLLGAAIEHLTGEPFARWMQAQLLEPMGMADSSFSVAPPTGTHAAAALDIKGKAETEPGLRDTPAGGLNTTVTDLLQLARLWFSDGRLTGHQILTPTSVAAMQSAPSHPLLGDQASVGLGWHVLTEELDGVGPLLWHAGGTPHHHAQLMLLPQLKLAVAVMSSAVVAGELAQETALKAMALMAMAKTGIDPVRPLMQGRDEHHPPVALSRLAGRYDTPLGLVHIQADGAKTSASSKDKRLDLVSDQDGYARLRYRLLGLFPVNLGRLGEIAFTRHDTPDRQTWLLVRRKGRFTLLGTRLDPVPIADSWRQRMGLYRYAGDDPFIAGQFKSVRLFEEAGLLLVEVDAGTDSTRVALAPVDDRQAIVRGLGRGRGDTVQAVQENHREVLMHSGMRFVQENP